MNTKEAINKVKANLEKKSNAYQAYMKKFMKDKGKTMADMSKEDWKELGAGWKSKKESKEASLEDKVAALVKQALSEKKEKIAKSDFVRNTQKFKHFSESEKSLIKDSLEASWKRGDIKDKALARLTLRSLGSSMADEK